jgi:hypothetical protein
MNIVSRFLCNSSLTMVKHSIKRSNGGLGVRSDREVLATFASPRYCRMRDAVLVPIVVQEVQESLFERVGVFTRHF